MPSADPSPIHLWDSFWSASHSAPPASAVVDVLQRHMNGVRGKRILEIGAGTGRDIVELAKRGAIAHANDLSRVALANIASLARSRAVEVTLDGSDLRSIGQPSDSFDAVYSVGVVEHFLDPDNVIREQLRLLKPGGFLVVDVPQTFNLWTLYKQALMRLGRWPHGWETQFSARDLRRLGERHKLELLEIYGWGEHASAASRILNLLDKSIYTCTCIGVVYRKH